MHASSMFPASNCIDGNVHTMCENIVIQSKIILHFSKMQRIHKVQIINENDQNANIIGTLITAGTGDKEKVCGTINTIGKVFQLQCNHENEVSVVTIQNTQNVLQLMEIIIYGSNEPITNSAGKII